MHLALSSSVSAHRPFLLHRISAGKQRRTSCTASHTNDARPQRPLRTPASLPSSLSLYGRKFDSLDEGRVHRGVRLATSLNLRLPNTQRRREFKWHNEAFVVGDVDCLAIFGYLPTEGEQMDAITNNCDPDVTKSTFCIWLRKSGIVTDAGPWDKKPGVLTTFSPGGLVPLDFHLNSSVVRPRPPLAFLTIAPSSSSSPQCRLPLRTSSRLARLSKNSTRTTPWQPTSSYESHGQYHQEGSED